MAPRKPTILVVTEDPEPSQAISAWLREPGLRVIGYPGPQPPSYLCAGERGESCPFAVSVDVVVLDLWLASDTMLRGTPARQLLSNTWTWEAGGGPATPRRPSRPLCRRRDGAGAVVADPACAPGAVFRRLPALRAHPRSAPGR